MAEKSRTEYSARNTTVAMISRIAAILFGYITRIVFTHMLSQEYVGVNGLFWCILQLLTLMELGVGSAIIFAFYKPIADNDTRKILSILKVIKKVYTYIAIGVLALGLVIMPILMYLIRDNGNLVYLALVYLFYLFNAVCTYLFVYKKTLIDAHQLNYISVVCQTSAWAAQNLIQIILLITTKSLLLYASVNVICTLANNIYITKKAESLFPYIKEKEAEELAEEEKKQITVNIKALLMHKVGNVFVNNTDNLLLSAIVGTISVGIYSNYFLLIGSVRQVLEQTFQGLTASVGNLSVKESNERVERILLATFFMGQWMYGLGAICMYEVLDIFVGLSFGEKYIFGGYITLVLCLKFYITGMRQATLVFRDSMGIFNYDKYKIIPEIIINLGSSIILGIKLGVVGVFLGTLISTVTTSLWIEPYMLYKHKIKKSSLAYFGRYLMYAAVTGLLWISEDEICARITGQPLVVCILRVIVCFVMTNVAYAVIYCRTKEYKLLMEKGIALLNKKFNKA